MPLYRYVKAYPNTIQRRPVALSYILLTLGAGILLWVGGPILSFWVIAAPRLIKTVTPIPDGAKSNIVDPQVLSISGNPLVQNTPDFTNPNIWYPAKPQKKMETTITLYTVSIPKLKITDAKVIVGGDDLSKSLIHYGGTALPGEYGNTVIFGHSTLVQFFNPKDYKTIFSTLPNLKIGDSIYIKADGVQYRYVVFDMTVTEPDDLSPLEQQFDQPYITLITCVPPGTYLKRLNVKAKLEKYDQ